MLTQLNHLLEPILSSGNSPQRRPAIDSHFESNEWNGSLAPKGSASIKWERMNLVMLALAAVVTVVVLLQDGVRFLAQPAHWGMETYHLLGDVWLVGILPVMLDPFLGGKIWCRYRCPLASLMQLLSNAYTRLGISRYRINSNDKCIACGECTRNCLVGIDVMRYALLEEPIDNQNSSCIGCGIGVTVCPMDVLEFGGAKQPIKLVQIGGVQ